MDKVEAVKKAMEQYDFDSYDEDQVFTVGQYEIKVEYTNAFGPTHSSIYMGWEATLYLDGKEIQSGVDDTKYEAMENLLKMVRC